MDILFYLFLGAGTAALFATGILWLQAITIQTILLASFSQFLSACILIYFPNCSQILFILERLMSQLSVAKQNNIEGKIEEFIYSLANLSAKKNAFFATKY